VVVKVRERLAACKQEAQKSDVQKFNLRKLSEQKVRKQYHIKISKGLQLLLLFTAIEFSLGGSSPYTSTELKC